jgi:hypothetical protein
VVRFVYSAFGLRLCTNLPLTGLLPLAGDSAQDLRVWLNVMPPWLEDLPDAAQTVWHISSYRNERGEPLLKIWEIRDGEYLRFLYDDGTQFILDRFGTQVWATWLEPMTLEDTATYLLGPILGFVLRQRGFVTLHASAVAIGGSAVAFLGPQGAGKSTTAAALAHCGCAVLSDDIVALGKIENHLQVQPAYPQLNLWPTSVEALYGAKDGLPPLTPNWDKRRLDLTSNRYHFQEEPLPLGAVYFLGARSDNAAAPFIHNLSPHDGLMALIGNGYVTLPGAKQMRAREFDAMGRIAARVPLRQITPHAEPAHLPKLCEVILDDCQQVIQS